MNAVWSDMSEHVRLREQSDAKVVEKMPYISEEGRVTLRDIKRKHGLSTNAVAAIACVEPSLVYFMEVRGALSRKDVEKILGGISRVTGQNYSVETVGGYWIKQEE
jgi:hypothetical protein